MKDMGVFCDIGSFINTVTNDVFGTSFIVLQNHEIYGFLHIILLLLNHPWCFPQMFSHNLPNYMSAQTVLD